MELVVPVAALVEWLKQLVVLGQEKTMSEIERTAISWAVQAEYILFSAEL